jgi:hypothetical protein
MAMSDLQHVLRANEPRAWEFLLDAPPISDRKLRLYACACCRSVWNWLGMLEQRAVDVAERFADSRADDEERLSLADEAWYGWSHIYSRSVHTILVLLSDPLTVRECFDLCRTVLAVRGPTAREDVLRTLHEEIFGPPVRRPSEMEPDILSWHGGVAAELAAFIDTEGRYDALPVLADALEEAGCTDEEMFDHCRQRGRAHVRGCWVIDRVLGRER